MARLAKNGGTAAQSHPVNGSQCPVDILSIVVKPGPDVFLKAGFDAFSTARARVSWRERLLFMPWVSL